MSGTEAKSSGNVAVDCMLAMGKAFTPADKVQPDQMLLALTRAQRKGYDEGEERPVTEIFIAELRSIVDSSESVSMEKILLTVEAEIEEVSQDGNGYTAEGMKRVAVLSYMATMLRTEIKKKALQN